MPNRKIATPAVMELNSGLTQKPQLSSINIKGSSVFRNMGFVFATPAMLVKLSF